MSPPDQSPLKLVPGRSKAWAHFEDEKGNAYGMMPAHLASRIVHCVNTRRELLDLLALCSKWPPDRAVNEWIHKVTTQARALLQREDK